MRGLLIVVLMLMSSFSLAQKGQFMTIDEFKAGYFSKETVWRLMWVNQSQREAIETILNHRFAAIRIRYWAENNRSGWVFEEIGKELPITVGVIIDDDAITNLTVLEFRESRGGEVSYPFFTDQFKHVSLAMGSEKPRLNTEIDGVTGATLSVWALKRIALLALYCHQQVKSSVNNE